MRCIKSEEKKDTAKEILKITSTIITKKLNKHYVKK